MGRSDFRNLKVWRRAVDLTAEIYQLTKKLPKDEAFGLSSQMKRAAVSIPSNIAEGQGRESFKEYIHFLSIAYGSLCEIETQVEISKRMSFLKEEETVAAEQMIVETAKMLKSLLSYLKSKTASTANI